MESRRGSLIAKQQSQVHHGRVCVCVCVGVVVGGWVGGGGGVSQHAIGGVLNVV